MHPVSQCMSVYCGIEPIDVKRYLLSTIDCCFLLFLLLKVELCLCGYILALLKEDYFLAFFQHVVLCLLLKDSIYYLLQVLIYGKMLFKFFLSVNILTSPAMIIKSFAGYSSMGWHLYFLQFCMTSAQDLLAFIVSSEKSGVVLNALTLSVT